MIRGVGECSRLYKVEGLERTFGRSNRVGRGFEQSSEGNLNRRPSCVLVATKKKEKDCEGSSRRIASTLEYDLGSVSHCIIRGIDDSPLRLTCHSALDRSPAPSLGQRLIVHSLVVLAINGGREGDLSA